MSQKRQCVWVVEEFSGGKWRAASGWVNLNKDEGVEVLKRTKMDFPALLFRLTRYRAER